MTRLLALALLALSLPAAASESPEYTFKLPLGL